MQYDVSTPDEYLSVLEQDWRRDTLMSLREIIQRNAPELKEAIKYKMLSYEDDRGPVFALNAQKGYVSFYVGNAEKVDPAGELLGGLDCGKGCIRFKKSVKVPETRIDEFISRAAAMRRQGGDIEC
jgi:uncharacterized protein YdhG (YjbR/CyaY superfamily)